MGVKGLKSFLRNLKLVTRGNVTEYSGEKTVVDISHYLYTYKAAVGEYWLDAMVRLIVAFKKFNIHANPIFDGKAPPEKDEEKEERREKKNDLDGDVFTLKVDLDKYLKSGEATPLLLRTMEKIKKNDKKAKKITKFMQRHQDGEKKGSVDIEEIEKYIAKKESQVITISKEDIADLKTLFDLFGIPWIQAPGEAEALGCYLCKKGESNAIITGDTDVLAYGVGVFISDMETGKGTCDIIRHEEVLKELDLTASQFVDFCIMCEVDYNKNIKGVAIKTAYKHINKFGSIEEWHKEVPNLDISCLRYKRCREIFATYGNMENGEQYKTRYWTTMPNFPKIYTFLAKRNVKFYGQSYWKSTKVVFEDEGEMSEHTDDDEEEKIPIMTEKTTLTKFRSKATMKKKEDFENEVEEEIEEEMEKVKITKFRKSKLKK